MNSKLSIKKKAEQLDKTDFAMMQKSAIETIQQLSGNLWTDYNEHDPGVTIMDASNYALTELHHKCTFPLEDYLNTDDKSYNPDEFGLYRPDQVYHSCPVNANDYRKLIFDTIEEISDLWLVPNNGSHQGIVDIVVDMVPSIHESEWTSIHDKILNIYNQNRNLGEKLGKINYREKEKLGLAGEIILNDEANVSEVMARIYFTCAKYFNSGMKYHDLREFLGKDTDWPLLFNGPLLKKGIINDDSVLPIKTSFFVSDIHYLLKKTDGVKSIKNIFLTSETTLFQDEIKCKDILHSFTVKFPDKREDFQLLLLKNNKEAHFNFDETARWFKKLIADEYGNQTQFAGLSDVFNYPKGNFCDLSGYYSIQNEFPDFYGINDKGIPNFFSEESKAKAKQLKGYLLLFDLIMAGSMQELSHLQKLLNIGDKLPEETIPNLNDSVSQWDMLIDETKPYSEFENSFDFKVKAKNSVFDLLDSLYGEKSHLPFLNEYDIYAPTINKHVDLIRKRSSFIKSEPDVVPVRSRGINLLEEKPENIPGLKQWFSLTLGLPSAFELPVTNIFSKYSLRLLSDKEFYEDIKGLLNIDFVINDLNENFKDEIILDVPEIMVENPEANYQEFREKIYLLHHNFIFESFLRNGIIIGNYKIIQPEENVFILAYHAEEKSEWIGLGRFDNKHQAIIIANQLRMFLTMLNKHSENLYLIEHLLLCAKNVDEGYIIQIRDKNHEVIFNLLKPVARTEVFKIKSQIEEVLKNPGQFVIKETETGNQVILFETDPGNAVYCQKTFSSEEDATSFLENEVKNCKIDLTVYYQQSEGILLPSDFMDFGLTVVFPNWSARFFNEKFRDWCEELLEERRPAHMKINFLWLSAPSIRQFEKLYFAWRSAYANQIAIKERSIDLAHFLMKHLP